MINATRMVIASNDCGQVRRGKGGRYATHAETPRHLDHTCSVLGSSNRLLKCPAPAVRPPVHYPLSALPANTRLTAAHDAAILVLLHDGGLCRVVAPRTDFPAVRTP